MNTISVYFKNKLGKIKPLHGVCCAPYAIGSGPNQFRIDNYFKEGAIPYCRLHDCCGIYGLGQFVDITNIFPDFDADENDPASYNFHYTDEYITAIEKSGCKTYYRLGETIEWGSKKRSTVVPADFNKWARICEHVVMHYNKGWANGFNYGIEYWEIWNEPENPGNANGKCMWQGTKEEFFELYKVASKHLKACFPEIKIGGYGSCGFYSVTNDNVPESFADFVTYFKDFLVMAKNEDCPLDFYTWHIYTGEVGKLLAHARFARETLDEYGFTDTEAHLNEWNVSAEGAGFIEKHNMVGASFNAAVFAQLQNTNYVDKAMYYCFSIGSSYNGLLNVENKPEVTWFPFVAYKKLYLLSNHVKTETEGGDIYAVAAENNGKAAVLISNYNGKDTKICLDAHGLDGKKIVSVKLLDDNSRLDEIIGLETNGDFKTSFILKHNTVVLVEIE